ncbi:hypothetical protein K7432_000773 [Basidiobolus ranarum]|uniref:Group 1 truncated hemoglobin n=1 Tax=Basidiobolus ranarum TaxID=34480 RepID=A0ABR2WAQ0_9FUNG
MGCDHITSLNIFLIFSTSAAIMKPTSPTPFDEASLAPIVNTFYRYNLADKRINQFFAKINMRALLIMQTKFLTHALSGAGINKKIMSMHHRHLGLQDHHFDAVISNLEKALVDHNVGETEIRGILAAAEGTRESMLGRHTYKTDLE